MIQDITPHKLHNEWRPDATPKEDCIVFVFKDDAVLCGGTNENREFPCYAQLKDIAPADTLRYLFTIDETDCFLPSDDTDYMANVPGDSPFATTTDFTFEPLRRLRKKDAGPRHLLFAAITASHLKKWYDDNRFCGRCGHPMTDSISERARTCTACNHIVYPRINPAVIVGVTNGDKLLMTKYADRPLNTYALIAGFNEIGETLEETVRREVMEEAGLKVKNIRYYKSQPWGYSGDILSGFYCDVDGDDTIRMDRQELREAAWFTRDEIKGQGADFSLTHEMMMAFKSGMITTTSFS